MFSETGLRKIEGFSASEPVVSLYLNTEQTGGNAETHRLRLRNMLKSLTLESDVERIIKFFDHEYDWSGRAVAVFSCAPAGFFEYIPVAISIRDFIQVGAKPVLEPLMDQLDEYRNIGVALVDKQGARFFCFHLGELVDQEGILGKHIKHVKTGSAISTRGLRGGSIAGIRQTDETVDRNMRKTMSFGEKFFTKHHVKRIVIGGNDENIAHFKSNLSKGLQSIVAGTFAMDMTASHTEVWNKMIQSLR